MFNHKHYIPILRWKKAEQDALKNLPASRKTLITPLIELVPLSARTKNGVITKSKENVLSEAIDKMPKKILETWGREPLFLDVSEVAIPFQKKAINHVLATARTFNINVIPVFHLNSDRDVVENALSHTNTQSGRICLRIFNTEAQNNNLKEIINIFMTSYKLNVEQADLLLDFQFVTNDQTLHWKNTLNMLPYLSRWHTFTVAGGSFPKFLTDFDPEISTRHELKRSDWETWCALISQLNGIRKPSFSDYTIQHPYFEDTANYLPSANIRYAAKDFWVIMRGRSLKIHGYPQYLALARLLSKMQEFSGRNFSTGDTYIEDKSKDMNAMQTGNATTWLHAGINHHISLVADLIANLPL